MGVEHRFSIGHGRPVLGTESFALPTLDLRQLATAKTLKIGKNQFPVHNYVGFSHIASSTSTHEDISSSTRTTNQKYVHAAEAKACVCRRRQPAAAERLASCPPTQKGLLPARQRRKACFLPAYTTCSRAYTHGNDNTRKADGIYYFPHPPPFDEVFCTSSFVDIFFLLLFFLIATFMNYGAD